MPQHSDHHDAELLLRLYDLRREARLRAAREWFFAGFQADSAEDVTKRYPPGSQEDASYRMVGSYWEMAASIVTRGLINEDLFFENTGELWAVWTKLQPLLGGIRQSSKDPHRFENLEQVGKKYEAWMEKRAPGSLALRRTRLAPARGTPPAK
ncbi:MAG: hypothetical protein KGM47_03120 [Acidobacteriota bacterium]|nr:hypothetical protein [Acidobacteriota bacterium]